MAWLTVTAILTVSMVSIISIDAQFSCTDVSCLCSPTYFEQGLLWTCKLPWLRQNTVNFKLLPSNDSKFLIIKCDEVEQVWSNLWNNMFKNLPKLIVLKIENCQISQLPESAFLGLNKLEELTIKYSSLSIIHENSFRILPKLRLLELIASGVKHMPSLCNVKKLRSLNVSYNEITSFDKTGVKCDDINNNLPNFEVLDVSYNAIELVPAWFGESFPNLKRLTASDNSLRLIESDSLNSLSELMWLDISNNSIISYENGFIQNCTELQILALANNPTTNIPRDSIANHTKLVHLFLNNLSLNDNIWTEFKLLKHLEHLDLGSNRIASIDSNVMERMPLLVELDLSNNSISHFNIFTFKDQYKLRQLNLSGNLLRNIPKQAFKLLHSLKTLDISRNEISSFSKSAFKGLRKLKIVDLSCNKLQTLSPEVFIALPALQILNISHNSLSVFPSFHDMKSVEILDLSSNNLTSIDISTFFGLSGVSVIDLGDNELDYIAHGVFQHCQKLESLNLAKNNIRDIAPGGFLALSNLVSLNLYSNRLTEIVMVLSNLSNLRKLDLSFNLISKIYRGQFPDSVQDVDLSSNIVNYIAPFTFRTMNNLRNVRLEFNNLTTLSMLSVEISREVHPKPTFYISANPLRCDCALSWLKEVFDGDVGNEELYPNIVDLMLVFCTTVYNSVPKVFRLIPRTEFLCSYREKCEYNCPCCAVSECFCKYKCPDACTCLMSDDKTNIHKVHCENRNLTSVPLSIPKAVTELMLDGNYLTSLPRDVFKGLETVKTLYLNNSNIQTFSNSSFHGLSGVVHIYLDNNSIEIIPAFAFKSLNNLRTLHLENNEISIIKDKAFSDMDSLKYINFTNNHLQSFPLDCLETLVNKTSISLAGNPWSCDLDFVCDFTDVVTSYSNRIKDASDVRCAWSDGESDVTKYSVSLLDDKVKEHCSLNRTVYINSTKVRTRTQGKEVHIAALVTISVATGLIAGVLILIYWKRDLIQVWCFFKYGWRVHNDADDAEDDTKRPFDAFLSYSNKDELFVVNNLAPRLENGEKKYKLCLHYRDFPIGACIAETIVRSVECSKRTIMLISDNFLQSEWCRYEFQTAHHQVLAEKKNRLILILLHDIDKSKLDSQIKLYFKTRTYLKYNDPWFWDKLHYAMPDTCLPLLERNGTIKRERLPMDERFFHNGNRLSDELLSDGLYEVPQVNHYQTIESVRGSDYTSSSGHYEEVIPIPNPGNVNRFIPPPPIPNNPPPSRHNSIFKI